MYSLFDASVGTEELNHIEMVCTIVHQLTRNLTVQQIKEQGFADYYVDHTTGIYPVAASGTPWSADTIQSTGDPITDLMENMAAEQKARAVYDNILKLSDDPDVNEVIKFLRQREVVHFQRFGEAILTHSNRFGGYIACVKMQFIDIENYKLLLEILLLINVSRR